MLHTTPLGVNAPWGQTAAARVKTWLGNHVAARGKKTWKAKAKFTGLNITHQLCNLFVVQNMAPTKPFGGINGWFWRDLRFRTTLGMIQKSTDHSLITLETTLVTSSPPSTELKRCNLEIECLSFFNLNIIFDMCCVSTGKGVPHSIRHWSLFGECEKDGRYTIVTSHRWWDKDVCLVLQSSPQHIFRIAKQNH